MAERIVPSAAACYSECVSCLPKCQSAPAYINGRSIFYGNAEAARLAGSHPFEVTHTIREPKGAICKICKPFSVYRKCIGGSADRQSRKSSRSSSDSGRIQTSGHAVSRAAIDISERVLVGDLQRTDSSTRSRTAVRRQVEGEPMLPGCVVHSALPGRLSAAEVKQKSSAAHVLWPRSGCMMRAPELLRRFFNRGHGAI